MIQKRITFNPFELKTSTRLIISAVVTAAYLALFRVSLLTFSSTAYAFLIFPALTITIQWGLAVGTGSTIALFCVSFFFLTPAGFSGTGGLKPAHVPPLVVFAAGILTAGFLRGLLKKKEEREREYRAIVSNANSVIVKYNMRGEITFFNRFAENLFGYSASEVIGKKGTDTINKADNPEQLHEMEEMLHDILINTEKYSYNENKNFREDGSAYWMAWTNAPLYNNRGEKTGILCIGSDITPQKEAEQIIQQRLTEKDILLKEIHHRVKNNLQIISSILNLQEETLNNEEDKTIFKTCENRISSMALVHDHLYHSDNLARIDVRDYISALTGTILDSYFISPDQMQILYDIDEIYLNIDQAIPCGLILTELITNSMKHALVPDTEQKGTLLIKINRRGKQVRLEISDNGPGLGPDFNWRDSQSLGLKLVDALAGQLEAEIECTSEKGMQWILRFTITEGEEKNDSVY
jgi:PAS domain S-box-containing protein